jgi:hypothetical protein
MEATLKKRPYTFPFQPSVKTRNQLQKIADFESISCAEMLRRLIKQRYDKMFKQIHKMKEEETNADKQQ